MTLDAVRQRIARRLDEADRGDRGWFIITRVHVALSWLKAIAEYLESRGGSNTIELTALDYMRLAAIIESDSSDPGVQLRRHHLLVMDKPLQLLRRVNDRNWAQIALTEQGRALAYADDPAEVLERSLAAIRFAVAPWSPYSRIQEYNDFNVPVYEISQKVLSQCAGRIDRNEFDFFLSRVRRVNEIPWAVDGINEFRELEPEEQQSLCSEVSGRIPSLKRYQNWRDIALHTFSLFSLGTSMVRDGQHLLLTGTWVDAHVAQPSIPETAPQLRMPQPPEVAALLMPPAAPATNAGADAESFVAKILRSEGWEVAFYTHRRGYGFDLWARRGETAMVIEVKSSLAAMGSVTLTSMEYEAALQHADSYVLAVVENMGSETPQLRMIQNPANQMTITKREATSYNIARTEWLRAADDNT